MLTIIRLLFPRKCSSNYPSAIKVAGKKKSQFYFWIFLVSTQKLRVSLKAGLPEKQRQNQYLQDLLFSVYSSVWLTRQFSFELPAVQVQCVCDNEWTELLLLLILQGLTPVWLCPLRGTHSQETQAAASTLWLHKWFWHSLRLLGAWEENLDGSSCHGWSLRGSWKTLFLLKGRTHFYQEF